MSVGSNLLHDFLMQIRLSLKSVAFLYHELAGLNTEKLYFEAD